MALIEPHVKVRAYKTEDCDALPPLVAAFRIELASFRGRQCGADHPAAARELQEYLDKSFPVLVAESDAALAVGYLVCRVDDDTVWAESLFVSPAHRRQGIAGMLYEAAEQLARDHGQPTLYNWIHPNNHRIIEFLRARGYDVLNLIEVRRPLPGEEFQSNLRIGEHDYRH